MTISETNLNSQYFNFSPGLQVHENDIINLFSEFISKIDKNGQHNEKVFRVMFINHFKTAKSNYYFLVGYYLFTYINSNEFTH